MFELLFLLTPLIFAFAVIGAVLRFIAVVSMARTLIAHATAFESQHDQLVGLWTEHQIAGASDWGAMRPQVQQKVIEAADHWRHMDALRQQRHELHKADILRIAGQAGIPISF